MRTPRIVILVFFCTTSLFLLCRSLASIGHAAPASALPGSQSSLRTLLAGSFNLFPPNAAISLTEDNSTSFPGRPAAYGPPLPNKGISGLLWIGIGFSEDIKGGDAGEGELGCSDVPGWDEKPSSGISKAGTNKALHREKTTAGGSAAGKARNILRARRVPDGDGYDSHSSDKSVDDGTDDYLHEDMQSSEVYNSRLGHGTGSPSSTHADIQSLQEAAEISGRIVLLSRGGCGFLEKTMWAQRRGAVALIVGDNVRGGPLIQMYAHKNAENVSIPSVFTSRTTAHLLSSLAEAGSLGGDFLDDGGRSGLKVQQQTDKARKNRKFAAKRSPSKSGSKTAEALRHNGQESTSTSASSHRGSGDETGSSDGKPTTDRSGSSSNSQGGLLSKLFGDDDGADFENPPEAEEKPGDDQVAANAQLHALGEGLWITITPTRSGVPFFDTLVLVLISPMITLALVYGLLILRGFVRRRRWRAPKSVVARLPVRTYRTIPEDAEISNTNRDPASRHPAPTALASATTPLLQSSARLSPRPRSSTTTAVPDFGLRSSTAQQASHAATGASDAARTTSRNSQVEKALSNGNQWKKFQGRQLECVICLDEYIDGVSKVMSLPCGHEFHVDCM